MEIIINSKLAKRNRQIANWLFLATFLGLLGSFIYFNYAILTNPVESSESLLVQFLSLPVILILGILSLLSARMTNLWGRQPYPEDTLAEGLKSLSKKSILFHYYHFPARHVLIAPQGVFVIITRWHDGKFTVDGEKWKTHKSAISRFFSAMRMDGVGQPHDEAQRAADHLKSLLKNIAPDVEVKPLVVFVSPKAELEITNPPVPILYVEENREPSLNSYMRELNDQMRPDKQKKVVLPLTDAQIEAFKQATIH